jgi:hypothetical protein
MSTFEGDDYEGLCTAMAMIDAAISNLDSNNSNDNNGWTDDLNRIRNEMNDERLALLKPYGDRIYHVGNIPHSRQAYAK